uniref:Uncharacterized protein n=1 Tax=Ditylenchus dipsaci TaxID=166011 RepID=A0A915EP51_9BILA
MYCLCPFPPFQAMCTEGNKVRDAGVGKEARTRKALYDAVEGPSQFCFNITTFTRGLLLLIPNLAGMDHQKNSLPSNANINFAANPFPSQFPGLNSVAGTSNVVTSPLFMSSLQQLSSGAAGFLPSTINWVLPGMLNANKPLLGLIS